MNTSKSSVTATVLVVMFVAFGIGIALVVLLPSGFPQRVLALAAGCGLAFGMVTAAGHLAQRLRGSTDDLDEDDPDQDDAEPVTPMRPAVLLRELTGPVGPTDRIERPTGGRPPTARAADRGPNGLSSAAAAGSRHPRG